MASAGGWQPLRVGEPPAELELLKGGVVTIAEETLAAALDTALGDDGLVADIMRQLGVTGLPS